MSPPSAPAKSCGTCTLCCRLPEIEEFSKEPNLWCRHCDAQTGCGIYAQRPALCRDFFCSWLSKPLEGSWEPQRSHMMVYEQGPQITILVDPDYPEIWRQAHYQRQMRQWAANVHGQGGYVIVYVGDVAHRVLPDADAAPACGEWWLVPASAPGADDRLEPPCA